MLIVTMWFAILMAFVTQEMWALWWPIPQAVRGWHSADVE